MVEVPLEKDTVLHVAVDGGRAARKGRRSRSCRCLMLVLVEKDIVLVAVNDASTAKKKKKGHHSRSC